MFNKIEHIGIAVRNADEAAERFCRMSGLEVLKTEQVEREGVKVVFVQAGESKIEFLEPLDSAGPVAKFIEKNGEGMHHIAFDVADIKTEMAALAALGFELLSDTPKPGADGKLIAFLHPRGTNRVLTELCQDAGK